jgi:hypothetical protein
VAFPDALVVDVAGDGSIQMNIQEMATAVQYQLPVKVVILNNCYLGMVRQWQELFYDKRYACTCMDHAPDFVKLAEAFGAVGLRATTAGRGGKRPAPGTRNARSGDHGFQGCQGRVRLSDGTGRGAHYGNAAGIICGLRIQVQRSGTVLKKFKTPTLNREPRTVESENGDRLRYVTFC